MIRLVIVAALAVFLAGCGVDGGYESASVDSAAEAPGAPARFASQDQSEFQTIMMERSVIRKADVEVRVDSVRDSEKSMASLVKSWGGYIESSESYDLASERPSVAFTIRVPVTTFESALDQIDELGVRLRQSVSGEDVTMQLVDIEARLKTLRAQEDAYREILRRATKISDVLEVQERLTQVRSQIESIDGQRKTLRELAALSTIRLTLQQTLGSAPPPGDPNWFGEGVAASVDGLLSLLRGLALVGVFLAVYSIIWAPIAVLFVYLVRRSMRRPKVAPTVAETLD